MKLNSPFKSTSLYLVPLVAVIALICVFVFRNSDSDSKKTEASTPEASPKLLINKANTEPEVVAREKARPSISSTISKTSKPTPFIDSLSPPAEDEAIPFLKKAFLSASFEAMAQNGSDLSLPMPSKHLIRSETIESADRIKAWGQSNDFKAGQTKIFRGHGGVEFYDVELIRTEVPDVKKIQAQGALIKKHIASVDDAIYTTWVGQIVTR